MSNNIPERLRGMFDMGVPSGDTFNHLTPAGFRLLREAHDEISALRVKIAELTGLHSASLVARDYHAAEALRFIQRADFAERRLEELGEQE